MVPPWDKRSDDFSCMSVSSSVGNSSVKRDMRAELAAWKERKRTVGSQRAPLGVRCQNVPQGPPACGKSLAQRHVSPLPPRPGEQRFVAAPAAARAVTRVATCPTSGAPPPLPRDLVVERQPVAVLDETAGVLAETAVHLYGERAPLPETPPPSPEPSSRSAALRAAVAVTSTAAETARRDALARALFEATEPVSRSLDSPPRPGGVPSTPPRPVSSGAIATATVVPSGEPLRSARRSHRSAGSAGSQPASPGAVSLLSLDSPPEDPDAAVGDAACGGDVAAAAPSELVENLEESREPDAAASAREAVLEDVKEEEVAAPAASTSSEAERPATDVVAAAGAAAIDLAVVNVAAKSPSPSPARSPGVDELARYLPPVRRATPSPSWRHSPEPTSPPAWPAPPPRAQAPPLPLGD
eukprot:TRINITY_DN7350_c0_g1_i3.p1 TRINITY_DN7350_c0_g1~~TRINITY_DN7350_c0_g1_i3.p1  ORF type:complete len:413 (-),score=80.60 TRINITY_DN7350_c0_g1_i3:106-1344(-)